VIIQVVLLGLMLSNNPIVLLLGTFFVYIIESALVQIYALVTSKQIHDGLVRNQMIPEALDGLYKFVVRMLVIGILISFVSIVSGLPLIWLGQLFSFVSWCAWLHFLNKIRKSLASPRIIRRMFWANIIRIVVQTIIATLLLFFVFSAIASSEIARGEKGNDHQTLSSTSVFFTILLAIDHILRLSLTGYLPWDACYLNRHQFFEEQRMARDPRVELEEDAPEYDDGL
jgi:flagellar biosynthesis protein FlhB